MNDRKPIHTPSARQVRAIRAWLGVKQPDFAKRCSVSHSALADFELGRRKTSTDVLQAIGSYISTLPVRVVRGKLVLDH